MLKSGKFLSFLVALISLQIITSFYQSSLDTSFQYHNSQHLSLCSCHFSIIIWTFTAFTALRSCLSLLVTLSATMPLRAPPWPAVRPLLATGRLPPPPAAPTKPVCLQKLVYTVDSTAYSTAAGTGYSADFCFLSAGSFLNEFHRNGKDSKYI